MWSTIIMKWRDIYELLEVEKQKGKLTTNERKRLRIFKERKAKVDAMPQQPCKVCGRMIPKPILFCSTKCKEADKCVSCPDKDKCKVYPRQNGLDEKIEDCLYKKHHNT